MRHQAIVLGIAATLTMSGTALAQTAPDTAAAPTAPAATTTTTTMTTTTTTSTTPGSNAGAYDALSEGNRKIVSAIYEAQLGSPKDTGAGSLLTRDDIAAMRQDTGWGNAYRQLYEQGYVTEKNLGQAISSHNHGARADTGTTIVTTAGGEQIAVGKGKENTASSAAKSAGGNGGTAKPGSGKSTSVTTAGGAAGASAASAQGKSAVITTAAGGAAASTAAAAHGSGVSNAGGNGNGQAVGKTK